MTNNPVELQDAIERVERFAGYLDEGWVANAGPRPDRLDPADLRTILSALSVSGDMREALVEQAEQTISAWAFSHDIDGAARNDLFARLRAALSSQHGEG